jgi:tetratricopeptide (TPR) repeat protein
MKKNSAYGRVLIWKVTVDAIKEQPLWGHGIEKFKTFYMEGQAGYLKDHPGTSETAVAGDNNYAFNEPLRIASETGLIGLALALLIIWSAFRNDKTSYKKQDPDNLILLARAGLLSVFIFGLFSYPAEIVPIMLNLILYLAIISGSRQPIFTVPIGTKLRNPFVRLIPASALVATAILGSQQVYRIEQSYTQWNEAYTTYSMGGYEAATEEYEKTYMQLKNNGDYLINYGKALSLAGKHEKAIEILEHSKNFINNTILYTALGDSYKATGQTTRAEDAYLHAWNMVPSRFYPKYLLAKLYDETGQHEKAVTVAKELLSKKIKIESTAVKEIQEEMRKIIEKQENTQNMFNPKGNSHD